MTAYSSETISIEMLISMGGKSWTLAACRSITKAALDQVEKTKETQKNKILDAAYKGIASYYLVWPKDLCMRLAELFTTSYLKQNEI